MSTPVITPPAPAMTRSQRISVKGEELLAKVRELIHQGNVRRIIVINDEGTSLLEFPLTAGVIGAIVAPVLVAVGAIAALAKNYTLLIEAYPHTTASKSTPPSITKRPRKRAVVATK